MRGAGWWLLVAAGSSMRMLGPVAGPVIGAGVAGGIGTAAAMGQSGSGQPSSAQPEGTGAARTGPPGVGEASPISAALAPFEGRLIRDVQLVGLVETDRQLVANQILSRSGTPLSQATVQSDVQKATRLGRFKTVTAGIRVLADQSVVLVFEFAETPIIKDVQVVGNRRVTDQDLRGVVGLLARTPVDRFQLDRTLRQIEELYRRRGFYQATVTIDEKELAENGIVVFIIREGERLRITDIRFEGNANIPTRLLRQQIRTEESGIFTEGRLEDLQVEQDVGAVIRYYRDRGYLDARCAYQVRPSPDGRQAILSFTVDEGPLYTLRSVRVVQDGTANLATAPEPSVIAPEQVRALIPIKPGDVYSVERVGRSVTAVRDAYGKLGYVDADVRRVEARDPSAPLVDLVLVVKEGAPVRTGLVIVRGNELTKDNVIRREVRVKPDRILDTTGVTATRDNLQVLRLFDQQRSRVTIQPADPSDPGARDVLVEVKETNTGSLGFGAAVSSDAGVVGQFTLQQRNFDLADTPDSIGELFTGRAFRGAGQGFTLALQPGTEVSNYVLSLSEPRVLDSDYSLGGSAFYYQRRFDEYDDQRLGVTGSLGRRFGERWAGSVFVRAESIDITNVNALATTDVFAVRGNSALTSVGASLARTTVDSRLRPSRGSRFEARVERVGALGGDYDFTRLSLEHLLFVTLSEDVLGRRTVLKLKTDVNWMPEGRDNVPIFERLYLGGRTFRGYSFRGVSPRGRFFNQLPPPTTLPSPDPVGGTWSFFFGPEIEQPLFQRVLSGVVFVDTGTVTFTPGFQQYRVSAGFGLRLYLPALGPAPLAFDFGFPIVKQAPDAERVFSFTLDIPF